ncbi:MAG: serine/threonine protein kinase [Candidatus Sumerlaeaceae bacterium]|nr:serine/threonine protein kinase [Candidatus Sumerlaeaceae bacterium]
MSTPLPEIPGYKTIREMGRGVCGLVFAAESIADRTSCALRVLQADSKYSHGEAEAIAACASKVAALPSHPNVARILGVIPGPPTVIAMELMMVQPLSAAVPPTTRLRGPIALEIARQVASGLAHAHQNGVVHGHIHPGNIYVAKDGTAKLTGFLGQSPSAGCRESGGPASVFAFLAPEQLTSEPICSPATDVYSLAAVLYEWLTGRRVNDGGGAALSVRAHRAELPASLDLAMRRALSSDPAHRFPNAAEFLVALEKVGMEPPANLADWVAAGCPAAENQVVTLNLPESALTPIPESPRVRPQETVEEVPTKPNAPRRGIGTALVVILLMVLLTAAAVAWILWQGGSSAKVIPGVRAIPQLAPKNSP